MTAKTTRSYLLFFVVSLFLYGAAKLIIFNFFMPYYNVDQKHLVTDFHYFNFFGQLPVFALGLITYSAYKSTLLKKYIVPTCIIFVAIVAMILILPVPTIVVKILYNHVSFGIGFSLFALLLSCYPIRLIVNRLVIELGKLSFSMYLIHFAVLELFAMLGIFYEQGDSDSITHYLCVVILTAVLSYVFYNFIEKPGVLIGRRLIDRLEYRLI
jgi:peptidoglycan/LPS O-acetylase OafA/YrhL